MKRCLLLLFLFSLTDAFCAGYTVFNASNGGTVWMTGANGDYYLPPGVSIRINPPADSVFDITVRYQVGSGSWAETFLGTVVNPQSDLVIVTHTAIDDTLGRPVGDEFQSFWNGWAVGVPLAGGMLLLWLTRLLRKPVAEG